MARKKLGKPMVRLLILLLSSLGTREAGARRAGLGVR